MAKRMNDDETMDYVYKRLFGDLDGIESHSLFDEDHAGATEGAVANAEPAAAGSGGVKITVEPLMAGAAESSKMSAGDDKEEEDEDKLHGISGMSPLMAQLHGQR